MEETIEKEVGWKKGTRNVGLRKATNEGKTIKFKDLKNVRVEGGTEFKDKPKAIYIKLSAWSTLVEDCDLDKWKRRLLKNIRQYTYNSTEADTIFNPERTIVTSTIPIDVMAVGKSTFIDLSITLYQTGLMAYNNETLLTSVNRLLTGMNIFFTQNDYVKFTKTK